MDEILNNPPDWETIKLEYKRYKRENNLNDEKIALIKGYKSANSFRNNDAYKKVVTGIVRLWLITK